MVRVDQPRRAPAAVVDGADSVSSRFMTGRSRSRRMFTGIVQGLQRVVWVRYRDGVRRLRVDLTGIGADVADGASIAVNGTCLTVAAHGADWADIRQIGHCQ